ncbi:MAG: hypothetical protein KME64_01160 [Scytonematopsis contorta HA4267-MV1]|nr:hypothetical protein [Scytonematopsis contorta HA4267-MV1]
MALTFNARLKAFFELKYGKPISDRSWYRIKSDIRVLGLEVSLETIDMAADLKKKTMFLKLPLFILMEQYLAAINDTKNIVVHGEECFKYLQKLTEGKAHKTTIIRWFSAVEPVNNRHFDKNRKYTGRELIPVVLAARLYVKKHLHKSSKKAVNPETVNIKFQQVA